MNEYEVKVPGVVPPGVDMGKLVAQFAKVFKLDAKKATTILTSGQPRTIGKNLDRARAEKIVEVLGKMGLEPVVTPPLVTPALVTPPDEHLVADLPQLESDSLPVFAAASAEATLPKATFESAAGPDAAKGSASNAGRPSVSGNESAGVESADDQGVLPEINQLPIGNGLQWLNAGFAVLKAAPVAWIAATIVALVLNGILTSIPFAGVVFGIVSWPILFAGLMVGAHRQAEGESFSALSFTFAMGTKPVQLALVGVFYLLASLVIVLVIGGLFYGLALLSGGELGGLTLTLIVFLCMMPPVMIIILAPSLVAIDGLSAVQACKLSVDGGLKNLLPFAVYLFASFIVLLLGALLFGIGILIAFPIVIASMYAAYRDIFS